MLLHGLIGSQNGFKTRCSTAKQRYTYALSLSFLVVIAVYCLVWYCINIRSEGSLVSY